MKIEFYCKNPKYRKSWLDPWQPSTFQTKTEFTVAGVEIYLHITKSEENVCLLWISGTWTKYFLCNYNRRNFIWIWKSTGVIYCMSSICKCIAININECGRRSYFNWDTFCKCVISRLWRSWLHTACLTIPVHSQYGQFRQEFIQ